MPTRASYAFSSTGQRTGFVSTVLERDLEIIGKAVEEHTGLTLEIVIAPGSEAAKPIKIFV
jgi:hypothetical protein